MDNFLKASHEVKGGVKYEDGSNEDFAYATGNAFLYIFPYGDATYVGGGLYNGTRARADLRTTTVFVQDKVTVSPRLTVNLGLRYDNPRMEEANAGVELADFHTFAPRLGLSYDFSGDGQTLAHASYGRYYDKVLTYSLPFFGGFGSLPCPLLRWITTDPMILSTRRFRTASFSPRTSTTPIRGAEPRSTRT